MSGSENDSPNDSKREQQAAGDGGKERLTAGVQGMESLAHQEKSRLTALKDGAHSGITGDFGKPLLEDGDSAHRGFTPIPAEHVAPPHQQPEKKFDPHYELTKDANGRVSEITRNGSPATHFEYDKDGHVFSIKSGDESMEKLPNDKWLVISNGKTKEVSANVEVDPDGTVRLQRELSTKTFKPDGTKITEFNDKSIHQDNTDGTSFSKDPQGRVTEAVYKNGDRVMALYDDHGGAVLSRWRPQEDRDGGIPGNIDTYKQPIGWTLDKRIEGKAHIDADGTLHIQDKNGVQIQRLHSTKVEHPVSVDETGHVSEVYFGNGDRVVSLAAQNNERVNVLYKQTPPGSNLYTLDHHIEGKVHLATDGTMTVEDKNGTTVTTLDGKKSFSARAHR